VRIAWSSRLKVSRLTDFLSRHRFPNGSSSAPSKAGNFIGHCAGT
jgi:hypothetical protein